MAEKTVRVCDLCLSPGGIAVSSGAISWRGNRGTVDVCQEHQALLEDITGAPRTPLQAEETPAAAAAQAPKRRGRPPKAKTEAPAGAEAPKRRGRPPKAKTEVAAAAQAPKRRGRPPKAKTEAPAGVEAPKRRGRPPKAKAEVAAGATRPKPTKKVTAVKKPTKTVLTPSPGTIREWAKANKVPVSSRGAVGAETLAAYYKAHPEVTNRVEVKPKAKKASVQTAKKGRPSKGEKAVPGNVVDIVREAPEWEDGPVVAKESEVPAAEFSGASK